MSRMMLETMSKTVPKGVFTATNHRVDGGKMYDNVFLYILQTLKTHKMHAFEPRFCPKIPQRRLFLGFSRIFLITFFGKNEIMCTFAPN